MNQVKPGKEFEALEKRLKQHISTPQAGCSIGHEWLCCSDKTITSTSPVYNNTIATIHPASKDNIDEMITRSHAAFKTWRMVPAPIRGQLVAAIGEKLKQHKDTLGSLVSLEMGKLKTEGDGEVQEMIDMAELAVGQSRMLYGKTMPSERPQHRLLEQWQPLGPITVISAFNFPVAVWSWNAFIAIVCGNTVIWKPSTKTPVTAIMIHKLCQEVTQEMGYEDLFSLCITHETELINHMTDSAKLPLVSFTGSTHVGKLVYAKVASRMGRCLLECGGNNAMIVSQHANLHLAVDAALFSAVGTTGQRCTSLRRCYIESSIYDAFLDHLQVKYSQVNIGDPLHTETTMGPLIDETAVKLFFETVEEACRLGGKVICGGQGCPELGPCYVQPTIIEVEHGFSIIQQEAFVPILYVMSYTKFQSVVAQQNDVPQGLSSALFSENMTEVEYFLSAQGSDCGIANINVGTTGAEIGGAFGGEKETGGGREAGSDAWKAYMRRQTVTINGSDALPLAQGVTFQENT